MRATGLLLSGHACLPFFFFFLQTQTRASIKNTGETVQILIAVILQLMVNTFSLPCDQLSDTRMALHNVKMLSEKSACRPGNAMCLTEI